jgi:DNA-binding NarL/FixJ family response regulator
VPPTVLIVDDHAGFRRLARRTLEATGVTVVGEAPDGASALRAARELDPDVVLLDVVLPDSDGFAVAERIAGECRRSVIVLTSSHEADDLQSRLERSAASAFLAKDELSGETLVAIATERR